MKLSLTLPTLFPGPAMRAIENVRATVHDMDYEIIVVSPFEVSGPDIRWVKEETPWGVAAAHASAWPLITGDVLSPLNDDSEMAPGWVQAGIQTLLQHERGRPYAVGLGQTNLIVGTVFGIYYPFFPLARRHTIEKVGGFFRPHYKHHFTDSDLAFRIWSIGGECGFTPGNYVTRLKRDVDDRHLAASRDASLPTDMATFLDFWNARYGKGWRTDDLRYFNIDIDPIFRMFVTSENTIYWNHPAFAEAHRHYVQMMVALNQRQTAVPSA